MKNDLDVSVSSPEEAQQLREDFEEILARVNGDLMSQSMEITDVLSVERAVLQAEQSINYHLAEFKQNLALQTLGPEIKAKFAAGIRIQARTAQTGIA